ncbi:Nicastrin [Sarcoptes scabiei]|uniref:Nicastrin n=1 Tax=Sarcoptes scabiei TaxID=52283 RepID=A0A834VBD0_SARSC|nr:Nicastrin [Sarcoptes scabiei]
MSDQINQTDFIEYQSYSHDSMCPNQNYGFRNLTKHCKTAWIVKSNPFYEFALIEWPFPIFLVRNYDIVEQIYYCHSRFKERCYVQLNSFMFGAINSKRCLSRNHNHQIDLSVGAFCQSIKAQNVFSPFSFIKANKELSPRSVLILTARLDSFTMFDSYSPGANSVYASVITLLAVAACVNQNRAEIIRLQRQNRRMHNVLYALFDAESFGHIGSDGWIFSNNFIKEYQEKNLSGFTGKFLLRKIETVIELNQLISSNQFNHSRFWVHSDWSSKRARNNELFNDFLRIASRLNESIRIEKLTGAHGLPSSTIEEFIKFDSKIACLLFSGFGERFQNKFYHSIFDVPQQYDIEKLTEDLHRLTIFISTYIFEYLTGVKTELPYKINKFFVRKLIDCLFGLKKQCNLYMDYLQIIVSSLENTSPLLWKSNEINQNLRDFLRKNDHSKVTNRLAIQMILLYSNSLILDCAYNESIPDLVNIHLGRHESGRNYCLFGQMTTDVFGSIYSNYRDDLSGKVKKIVDNMRFIEFSSWTQSSFDFDKPPTIHLFCRKVDSIEIFTFSFGICILILSILLVKYCQFNYGIFFVTEESKSTLDGGVAETKPL